MQLHTLVCDTDFLPNQLNHSNYNRGGTVFLRILTPSNLPRSSQSIFIITKRLSNEDNLLYNKKGHIFVDISIILSNYPADTE